RAGRAALGAKTAQSLQPSTYPGAYLAFHWMAAACLHSLNSTEREGRPRTVGRRSCREERRRCLQFIAGARVASMRRASRSFLWVITTTASRRCCEVLRMADILRVVISSI